MIIKTTYHVVRFSLRKSLKIIFEMNAIIKDLFTKLDIQTKSGGLATGHFSN